LQSEYQQLQEEIATVFTQTVPGRRMVNPLQQLKILNNGIRQAYKPGSLGDGSIAMLDILAELSTIISVRYEVTIVRFIADLDAVRIKALTRDFNTVDNVQKELEKSPMFASVEISSANQSPRNDEVSFELRLELSR
jgi:hypothetical protein